MKYDLTIELSRAELNVLKRHWGQQAPVTASQVQRFVVSLAKAAIVDYDAPKPGAED